MNPLTDASLHTMLNKVPEVTLVFWLIKMLSTTVGETGADFLIFNLGYGMTLTSVVMGALLVATLAWQMGLRRYVPEPYWLTVVLVSIFGTLVTDNLTDQFGVPLAVSTGAFAVGLIVVFALWHRAEGTLSIAEIDNRPREAFYWLAILITFALGTAAGDWVGEGLGLGYSWSAVLFGGMIAVVAAARFLFNASAVATFWIAYVLTRPLGASCGDLLAQSPSNGGLGLGTTDTSIIFLVVIVGLVIYLRTAMARPAVA
ncbi:MAG: hypothetical protein JWN21_334 [Sphingomonas bacterium]|uniref:COG4705 family protein n=1 Tax=Sphingomonas bacterium TaxID=1895847 RepID=UPI0026070125|nr:hypothetical protein [Sphingomonas bacterium]MDB5694791.1 hypothetical protein [Sphingomonas bacterium]